MIFNKTSVILSVAVILNMFLHYGKADARPEFAQFTGSPCSACHISSQGGGPLKPEGEEFKKQLRDMDIPVDPDLRITSGQRLWHFALYLVHLPFGVGWVGLVFFTFGPALRKRNLVIPSRPYTRQLIYCMAVVLVTGPLLVAGRIRMVPDLFTTRFGMLLVVKILAALLLGAATMVLLWYTKVALARRYRRLAKKLNAGINLDLEPDDLLLFNGDDKRKALVAVDGWIYDVTGRELWRKGIHPGGHHAGQDLTSAFSGAPHGKEVLERVKSAGMVVEPGSARSKAPMSWAIPLAFGASLIIIMVVVLWRW